MVRGLMLIKIAAAPTPAFVEEAKKISGVIDAYPVFGRFDTVVFLEGKTFQELKGVAAKVAKLKGVKSTETLAEGD